MVLMFFNIGLFAQGYVKGIVTDGNTSETLIGASVYIKGTTTGATTDAKGAFKFEVPTGPKTIVVQYVGYIPIEVEVSVKSGQTYDMGTIKLDINQIGLKEVIILASVAVSRKTPVAISTLEPKMIEERLGTMEFPEILKSTPGVYATKQGGGYGDSRINLRGFESSNTAVMINGVPVNDMEWGGVYWSNWAGLADVTRSMQVQRGLGASKVSAPSLGGSINILTNTTDAKKGGSVSYGMANNGYSKIGFSISTGLTDKNWAISLLGAKTSGNGYIQGTEFESYSYFANISKKINGAAKINPKTMATIKCNINWSAIFKLTNFNGFWLMFKASDPTYSPSLAIIRLLQNSGIFGLNIISLNMKSFIVSSICFDRRWLWHQRSRRYINRSRILVWFNSWCSQYYFPFD